MRPASPRLARTRVLVVGLLVLGLLASQPPRALVVGRLVCGAGRWFGFVPFLALEF